MISDRRILDHLLKGKVFANVFTGYPKISDAYSNEYVSIESSLARH